MQEAKIQTVGAQAPAFTAEDIAIACDDLQRELDALLNGHDADKAVSSMGNAIVSIKEVEQRNVSTVQLVAL